MTRKQNWGEDRVMFFDAQGRLRSMLTSWTNLADEDAFARTSAGRSWFRVDDLLKLIVLLERHHEEAVEVDGSVSDNLRRGRKRIFAARDGGDDQR
jgi:hypothetical protein